MSGQHRADERLQGLGRSTALGYGEEAPGEKCVVGWDMGDKSCCVGMVTLRCVSSPFEVLSLG
jgi:hypothetical protein